MIKKLRIKLVMAAMASLLVVLTSIIGIASGMTYHNLIFDADSKLQLLVENGGVLSKNMDDHGKKFSPEMPFELRFFSVSFFQSNATPYVNVGRIAGVDAAQAMDYANQIMDKGSTHGFVDTYRFIVVRDEKGNTQIFFLDCYRELQSFYNYLQSSLAMSFIGFIAVFILLILTSQRIIKPVSESYEKQRRFITDAGHELKTPLTIISADTEVLEMDYGENEWLNDIRTQTTRLADLTNNLVFLARMEEQPQGEFVDFSLSSVVQEAADDFQAVARLKEKELSAIIEPGLQMHGDKKNIRRLVAIFLDNAVKYTNEHGKICVTVDKWHGQHRLQVYNTTDHISQASLRYLFDRFYRTDSSRNSKTGGYGLGLSIASAIVALHHGKIMATTSDEKSLLITVTFPTSIKA